MRRSDREVTHPDELLAIIEKCKVLRIALNDTPAPYIVPVNFGYHYQEKRLTLYIHCALQGRKVDLLEQNPQVGFEMDCGHELVENETPCRYGFRYASIIGWGRAEYIESGAEKGEALNFIMQHQSGKTFQFSDEDMRTVRVYRIEVESFSGKQRL